nr:immunoglobulin heavy chain junction region [Homo sapiens]MOM68765.1 immunoglobulin heavy chain junction region [Homo sapiens]
CVGGIGDYW